MSFESDFENIDYVEIDDDTISLFQDNRCVVDIPKCALSVMIMLGENILLDLESRSKRRKKYWSDENTAIYSKRVFEVDNNHQDGRVERRVLCIMDTPHEIVLKKDAFQLMLISAAVACRIDADPFNSRIGTKYSLDKNKTVIFQDSQRFSIAAIFYLRAKNCFGGEVYWRDEQYEIITEFHDERRMLTFAQDYRCGHPSYISISSCAFERMIHIATSGPSWSDDMSCTMKKIRDLFWKSIPINTVKSIEFPRNGRKFTLVNEVNGETLTFLYLLDEFREFREGS